MGVLPGVLDSGPDPLITQQLPFNCSGNECTISIEIFPCEGKVEPRKVDGLEEEIDGFSVSLRIAQNNLHLEVTDIDASSGPISASAVKYNVPESVFLVRFSSPDGREEHLARLDRFKH